VVGFPRIFLTFIYGAHNLCASTTQEINVMSDILSNPVAPKKSVNLSINADLLLQAKQFNINLSQALEQRLAEIVREEKRRQWLAENQGALEEYNRRIEASGTFSDGLRRF
jgi:antitoxin CcdA